MTKKLKTHNTLTSQNKGLLFIKLHLLQIVFLQFSPSKLKKRSSWTAESVWAGDRKGIQP